LILDSLFFASFFQFKSNFLGLPSQLDLYISDKVYVGIFLPRASKIEQSIESQNRGCDEHQDEHKDLYEFGPLERNTLHLVWVSIFFIDLSEFDQRPHNRGITSLRVL
jgi:hypothetical protein